MLGCVCVYGLCVSRSVLLQTVEAMCMCVAKLEVLTEEDIDPLTEEEGETPPGVFPTLTATQKHTLGTFIPRILTLAREVVQLIEMCDGDEEGDTPTDTQMHSHALRIEVCKDLIAAYSGEKVGDSEEEDEYEEEEEEGEEEEEESTLAVEVNVAQGVSRLQLE